jgi:hypothetical protein
VDRALELEPAIRDYLRQPRGEVSSWEESRAQLVSLVGGPAVESDKEKCVVPAG